MMAAYGQGQPVVERQQIKAASQDTEDAAPLSGTLASGQSFYVTLGVITLLEVVLVLYLLRSIL